MARAIALARHTVADPADLLRSVIVCGCALAVVLAG